jgi:DNA-binding transcriptional regulator YiaG
MDISFKNKIANARSLLELTEYQDDKSFSRLLVELKSILNLSNSDFARRFATTSAKVEEWLVGSSLPHPHIRSIMVDWLGYKLSTLENIDEISLDDYKKILSKADAESDVTFQIVINLALKLLPMTEKDFYRRFDMSVPSMKRWINGTSAPHPIMRKRVFEFIESKINNPLEVPSDNGSQP